MNWRERVSVSIPCFGIRFSAVLYITNAPSIQMIQQLLGSPVLYQFYDMRVFVHEASSAPCYTTSFWYIIYYHNVHLCFEGSCVTRGGGGVGQYRIRKSWNPYIFFQINALMDIKISIIDICYANTAPIPKTLMVSLLHEWKI